MQVMKVIDDLLSQDVDRKQFLIQREGILLALVGVARLLKALPEAAGPSSRVGYDSGNHGGGRSLGQISRRLS